MHKKFKVKISAAVGASIRTMAYIIKGVSESLLVRSDTINLGIVEFHLEGSGL